MRYEVLAPAAEPVITLAEAKDFLRVDFDAEDDDIAAAVAAATETAAAYLNRPLLLQTQALYLDEWPACGRILLERLPLVEVLAVTYRDTAETTYQLPADQYVVASGVHYGAVALRYNRTWPTAVLSPLEPICVQFRCGWIDAATLPWRIKAAIKLATGHLYRNRESVLIGEAAEAKAAELPQGFHYLLDQSRTGIL